jgi:hypothetical protein
MSPASTTVLLGAILEDFSQVTQPHARISRLRPPVPAAVACQAVDAEALRDRGRPAPAAAPAPSEAPETPEATVPLLIHGAAPAALAAWKSAALGDPARADRPSAGAGAGSAALRPRIYGIDIARGLGRRGAEAAHSSLGMLTDLPRSVPVTVSLCLGEGWRDTMALIRARGRGVRFHVYSADSPGRRVLADAIRAAVAEGCAFSWACAAWQPVTEPAHGSEPAAEGPHGPPADGAGAAPAAGHLPGILNILLATARALQGADSTAVAAELARTDRVDVVDAVRELSPAEARRIRRLLRGFAVYRTAPVVDALTGLGLLPKVVGPASLPAV